MGHFLATHLGSKYRVIGGTFGGSSDSSVGTPALSASVDGLLGATASPLSFLDLHRPHTGLIASWLTSPVRIRVNDRYELVALAHAFDGLVSVRSVSEVHLLQ
jgi:hypothetical protein